MSRLAALIFLLASLVQADGARAYERDLHYYVTFALAVATGWRWQDARVIASADQGVDENKETVAALESDVTVSVLGPAIAPGIIHQAAQNFALHSFSPERGDSNAPAKPVRDALNACRTAVELSMKNLAAVDSPRARTELLVATGVYLHCSDDIWSHQGYGGTCFQYRGNCLAHVIATKRDSAKHRTNPDHPFVKRPNLVDALKHSSRELHRLLLAAGRMKWSSADEVPPASQSSLVNALQVPEIAALADDERIRCHAEIAGASLAKFLADHHVRRDVPAGLARPAKDARCRVALPDEFKDLIAIPDPRYPRLRPSAGPRRVANDGTYDDVTTTRRFDLQVDSIEAKQNCGSIGCLFRIKFQVSNLGPSSAEAYLVLLAIIPKTIGIGPFGIRIAQPSIRAGEKASAEAEIRSPGGPKPIDEFAVYADIQPGRSLAEEAWNEANVANDNLTCLESSCRRAETVPRQK